MLLQFEVLRRPTGDPSSAKPGTHETPHRPSRPPTRMSYSECFPEPHFPAPDLPASSPAMPAHGDVRMESNVWLFVVKGILLLLNVHSIGVIASRLVRILNQFGRLGRKQTPPEAQPSGQPPPSAQQQPDESAGQQPKPAIVVTGSGGGQKPPRAGRISPEVQRLSPADLEQVKLISLAMLAVTLAVCLLQVLTIYLDHFPGICLFTAFALVALIGDFKNSLDPIGQMNLVIWLLNKSALAAIFLADKSNFYNGRRKRRYSLQQDLPFNTYSLKR